MEGSFEDTRMENAIEITLRVRYAVAIGAFSKIATFDSPRQYLVRHIEAAAEALSHFEELNRWLWVNVDFDAIGFAIASSIEVGQAPDVTRMLQERVAQAQATKQGQPVVQAAPVKRASLRRRTRQR